MRIPLGTSKKGQRPASGSFATTRALVVAQAWGNPAWLTQRRFVDLGRTESMICHPFTY